MKSTSFVFLASTVTFTVELPSVITVSINDTVIPNTGVSLTAVTVTVNVIDLVIIVDWILSGMHPENSLCLADVNNDGLINVTDIVSIVDYIIY